MTRTKSSTGIRKVGGLKPWEARISLGRHEARRCETCGRRYWTAERMPVRCTVTKRDGRVCNGALGRPEETLRQRERRFRLKAEADAWLKEKHVAFETKVELPKLAEYVETYLDRKRGRVTRETWNGYARLLRTYAIPVAGHRRLDLVTKLDVRTMLDDIVNAGLARQTAAQFKAILANALNEAVEVDLLQANVATAIRLEKSAGKPKPKLAIPVWDDVLALVSSAEGTPWHVPLILCASAGGLRRSEALGLAWDSVDLDGSKNPEGIPEFQVEATLHVVGGGELEHRPASTKSEDGYRRVPLTPEEVAILRRHKLEQAPGATLVCTTPEGHPLHPDTFTRTFRRMADRAGLDKRVHLHSVRHAVIKELRRCGVSNKVISELVGHKDPAFTEAVYGGDSATEMLVAAAASLRPAVGG